MTEGEEDGKSEGCPFSPDPWSSVRVQPGSKQDGGKVGGVVGGAWRGAAERVGHREGRVYPRSPVSLRSALQPGTPWGRSE